MLDFMKRKPKQKLPGDSEGSNNELDLNIDTNEADSFLQSTSETLAAPVREKKPTKGSYCGCW